MRRRIFDIIQIGNKEDAPSRLFDYTIVVVILLNILALFLETFDQLSFLYTAFRIIEYGTMGVFAIEYFLRIWTADYLYPQYGKGISRIRFICSFDGVVDLLTIVTSLPFISLSGFVAFRILRIIRIFHLFRVNSQYDSFQVIISVLHEKWRQILSAVVIILILMLGSSLAMYNLEHEAQPEAFANAFSGIWWSVSCLLTVGYGDIYPITVAGRILAIIIAFLGVGVVAIPTGIISAGFVEQYSTKAKSEETHIDVKEIGEVMITKSHPFLGHTIEEILKDPSIHIFLVMRGEMTIVPTSNLVLIEDDIIIVQTNRLQKK